MISNDLPMVGIQPQEHTGEGPIIARTYHSPVLTDCTDLIQRNARLRTALIDVLQALESVAHHNMQAAITNARAALAGSPETGASK